MLPWIGARDYVDQLGFIIERCPACQTVGVFGVYQTKRKLTVYFVPTVPYAQQQVLECKACHARFGVAEEQRDALAARLMTQEEISARVRQLGAGPGSAGLAAGPGAASNGRRTAYQVLQVDPDADPEVIEAAFKRLAFKYHPDRSTAPDAAARMREMIEARELLTDPHRRRAYDAALGIVRPPPRPPALRPEEV